MTVDRAERKATLYGVGGAIFLGTVGLFIVHGALASQPSWLRITAASITAAILAGGAASIYGYLACRLKRKQKNRLEGTASPNKGMQTDG